MTGGNMTLEQMFENFIREKQYIENCAPKTIKYFRQCFKTFRRIIADDEVSPQTLTRFVVEARQSGMSAGCFNSYSKGLNSFFDWLHENELTAAHLRIKLLKQEKKVLRSFSDDELRRVLTFKPQTFGERRIHVLTLALLDTGARIDELLTLTRDRVDFESLIIKVKGKGNKERVISISVELRRVLIRYLKTHDHALVFPARNGAKFDYQNAYRDFTDLQRHLYIAPIGFHALRRTFAKNYLRHGGNLLYLKAILGHERLETTEKYIEVEESALQETHARTAIMSRLR
jgi:site-specific recombinase XerD